MFFSYNSFLSLMAYLSVSIYWRITMTGVRINDVGAITELARIGTQIDNHASSSGFLPYKQVTTVAHTTSTFNAGTQVGLMAVAGLQTISGAVTHSIRMPSASLNPGAIFAFRNLSAQGHILTGSGEAPFVGVTPGFAVGSSLAMGVPVGSSVVLFCDGVKYTVMGGSGSVTGT
jgi:hypothetical protein